MTGSPFDYPLSSRLDENDVIFTMDRVLVPWENVFSCGDVERADHFLPETGFMQRFLFHGCTRLVVKLDFITALVLRAVGITGSSEFGGRHELCEINYAGGHEEIRRQCLFHARKTGELAGMDAMVSRCLAEYDLSGWRCSDLFDPGDLSVHGSVPPGA